MPARLDVRGVDVVAALLVAAIQVVGSTAAGHGQPDRRALDWLGYLLLVLGPLALTLWRRHVRIALAAVTGVTLVYLLVGYPYGPFVISVVLALVAAVLQGERAAAWIAAGVLYGVHFAGIELLDLRPGASAGALLAVASWLLVTLVGAELLRVRLDRRREAARRREQEAERRAGEERLRMARDLHDVLAHSISLINVQAGVALHLIDERPEQARPALAAIKEASRDALQEVRATLGVLRGDEDGAELEPGPRLARVGELAEGASVGGLRVDVEVEGRPRAPSLGVDQAAYRIVQEALTNVRRHAAATTAVVRLRYAERALTVDVEDDGRGPAGGAGGGGSGIAGMRARAEALGGRLAAGPGPAGGFRVTAELPLREP